MYTDFSFYKEGLVNLVRKGAEGEQQIKDIMNKFRNAPPATIAGQKVIRILDYKISEEKNNNTKETKKIDLPSSDVLQFYTADGSKISVRPSGTEPKIKFYISVNTKLRSESDFESKNKQLDERIKAIEQEITK
jgi:phosphoglucomutase